MENWLSKPSVQNEKPACSIPRVYHFNCFSEGSNGEIRGARKFFTIILIYSPTFFWLNFVNNILGVVILRLLNIFRIHLQIFINTLHIYLIQAVWKFSRILQYFLEYIWKLENFFEMFCTTKNDGN